MKAVIPAAGFGTRFLPATKSSPKEMLPIVDKPVIQYVVEEAVAAGCDDILIITGRSKRAVEDHFDRSPELERRLRERGKHDLADSLAAIADLADIHFKRQHEQRGLGHAVLQARNHVGDEPFAVLLGDDMVVGGEPSCLERLWQVQHEFEGSALATEQVPDADVGRYGIIDPGEAIAPDARRVKDMVEKPSLADAPSRLGVMGRYVLEPQIFDYLADQTPGVGGEIQLTDALRRMAVNRSVYAVDSPGHRYDTGQPLGWLLTNLELGLDHPATADGLRAWLAAQSQ